MQAAAYGVQDVSGSHVGRGKPLPLLSTDGKGVLLALAPTLAVPAGLQHQEKMGLVGVKAAVPPSAMPGANSTFTGAAFREAWPFLDTGPSCIDCSGRLQKRLPSCISL